MAPSFYNAPENQTEVLKEVRSLLVWSLNVAIVTWCFTPSQPVWLYQGSVIKCMNGSFQEEEEQQQKVVLNFKRGLHGLSSVILSTNFPQSFIHLGMVIVQF